MQFDLVAEPQSPPQAFVWGQGGKRMSQEDIARQRALADAQMTEGSSFAPLGHWTQGAARLANAISGRMQSGRLDKAEQAMRDESASVVQALIDGRADPMTAMADPYLSEETRSIASLLYEQENATREPIIQRANNGDILGLDPMTGEVLFTRVDPNPKPSLDWMSVRNEDGTTTIVPVGVNGPIVEGASPVGGQPTEPPPEAIEQLRRTPETAQQFDEIFGPGASSRYLAADWGGRSMTVTPRELDALVGRYGPQDVQRRLDSGELIVEGE